MPFISTFIYQNMNSIFAIPDLFSSINTLLVFNTALENSTIEITKLNEGITTLSKVIDKLISSLATITRNTSRKDFYLPLEGRTAQEEAQGIEEHTEDEEADGGFEKVFKTTHNIIKITKNGFEGIEHLTELPHALGKVKKGVGILDDAMEAIGGLEELSEATGMLDGLAAGTGMLAGAEGLAVSLIPTGPLGWILGAGALLSAGILYATREHESPSISIADEGRELIDPQRWSDVNKTMAIHGPKALDERQSLYDESVSPYMIERVSKRDWSGRKFFGESAESSNTEAAKSTFDPINRTYLSEWANQYLHFQPPKEQQLAKMEMRDKIDDIKRIVLFDSVFAGRYRTEERGRQEITRAQNQYDQRKAPQIFKLPTEDEWDDVLRAEKGLSLRGKRTERAQRAEPKTGNARGSFRQITINLNRPMIEHFTITTNDSKEGLKDFKHKVEEVLLEILNNVNVN